ncbi:hypothetical protein [Peterkaempfera bronchialis]|nr:hypothetical protein [Peterkaempfera bronchialis]
MDDRDWDARYAATNLVWGAEPNRWVARPSHRAAPCWRSATTPPT